VVQNPGLADGVAEGPAILNHRSSRRTGRDLEEVKGRERHQAKHCPGRGRSILERAGSSRWRAKTPDDHPA
jgi:hypothetical protein